jgi:hypothetical protein
VGRPAGGTIVDILDAGGLTKARDSCARLEAFLASQRGLVFEQQGEPLGVFEGARFGIVIEFLEALCHAMQAERMQLIASGMGQHSSFSVS